MTEESSQNEERPAALTSGWAARRDWALRVWWTIVGKPTDGFTDRRTEQRLFLIVAWWFVVIGYAMFTVNDGPSEGLWGANPPRGTSNTVIEDLTRRAPKRDPHLLRAERTVEGISIVEIEAYDVTVPNSPDVRARALHLAVGEPRLGPLAELFTSTSAARRFITWSRKSDTINPLHMELRKATFVVAIAGVTVALAAGLGVWLSGGRKTKGAGAGEKIPFYARQRFSSNLTVISVLLVGPVHAGFVALQGGLTSSPVGSISAAILPFIALQAYAASKNESFGRKLWNYLPSVVFFLVLVVAHIYAVRTNDDLGRLFLGPTLGVWSLVGYVLAFGMGMFGLATRQDELSA